MRTTSSSESMHSQMNRSFPKKPQIFKFMECLKTHEFGKTTDLQILSKDYVPETQFQRKLPKDRKRDNKINHFSNLLATKMISVGEFLEAMADRSILPPSGMAIYALFYHPFRSLILFFCSITRAR